MQNFITLISSLCSVGQSSVLSSFVSLISASYAWTLIKNVLNWALNLILSLIWIIEKLVLAIMEALEYVINEFLGLGMTINDYASFATDSEISGTIIKTFRAIFVVAIVLMILFTIFAIIRQEWANATADDGMTGEKNKPGPIIMKLFKGIAVSALLPFIMLFSLGAVSSLLTAFDNALNASGGSIAGQVLAVSTYDSNKYRMYANENKRVPIIISAYNTEDYKADEEDEMVAKIQSTSVQTKLINTVTNIEEGLLLSFSDSLTYSNNKLTNSAAYGDYYEQFVCTAEQYQVMADFIDYCQLNNVDFYIRSIDDPNIDWKYVESAVYSESDGSLTISYKDATDITGDGSTSDSYTITYTTSYEVTSQISNTLDTISALLGINDYSDLTYYTMERDSDSINVVSWATDKVSIHFSYDFNLYDSDTWTSTDEIILYEYYHYSANNTLSSWTLDDLSYENRGNATLDSYKIVYKDYYASIDQYSDEKEMYCVLINGTYYETVQSETETDDYGNPYYVLREYEGVSFLSTDYSVIATTTDTAEIKFVGVSDYDYEVDLNNSASWGYTDQIIIYEYYKDLSVSNDLNGYTIYDFVNGIDLPVYKITEATTTSSPSTFSSKYYVLINSTYYQVEKVSGVYSLCAGNGNFFEQSATSYSTDYGYSITLSGTSTSYGIDTGSDTSSKTADSFVSVGTSTKLSIGGTEYTVNFDVDENASSLSLTFSSNFKVTDTDTWTFRDYFLFYLYCGYLRNISVDVLKYTELPGDVCLVNGTYYFRINSNYAKETTETGQKDYYYLKIDDVNLISEELITTELNYESVYTAINSKGYFDTDQFLLLTVGDSTVFTQAEISYRTFKFSDAGSANVSSWTMEDYILYLLNSQGIISLSSGSTYNSLIYIVDNLTYNDESVTYKFYRFGTGSNTVYLNEQYIYELYERLYNTDNSEDFTFSIDDFLSTNLVSFVTAYISGSAQNSNSLIAEEDQLIASIANGLTTAYSFSDVVALIAENYSYYVFNSNDSMVFEYFDSVQSYEYVNSSFVFSDLTTWTIADFIIYYLTGSASGSYTSNLVEYNSTDYFIIGDYAVKYSDIFSSYSSSATISSTEISLASGQSLADYYSSNLSSYLVTVSKSSFNWSRADSNTYKYTTQTNSGVYTELDAILSALGDSSINTINYYNYVYTTYLYTDGTDSSNQYIYVGYDDDNYYFVKSSTYGLYPSTTSVTATLTSMSASAKTYETYSYNFNAGSSSVTLLDGIIYYLTGDTSSSSSYQVYEFPSDKYFVYVGGYYIDYSSTYNVTMSDLSDTNKATLSSYLYQNYYKQYVSYSVTATGGDTFSYDNTKFSITDISTWTPIGLILYNLGFYPSIKTEYQSISMTYQTSSSGKEYLYFTIDSTTYYINISDFGTTLGGTAISSECSNDAKNILWLRAALLYGGSGTIYTSGSETISEKNTISSQISTVYGTQIENSQSYYATSVVSAGLSETDLSTWTFLDIAYYYKLSSIRSDASFVIYKDSISGNQYLGLTDGTTTTYVRFLSSTYYTNSSTFNISDYVEVTYSTSSNVSVLALLYYQNTGNSSGKVYYVKISDSLYAAFIQNETTSFFVLVEDLDATKSFSTGSENFSYTVTNASLSSSSSNISTWNLLDFAIIAASGLTSATNATYTSSIYNFDLKYYFEVNGYYINLSLIQSSSFGTLDFSSSPITYSDDVDLVNILGSKSINYITVNNSTTNIESTTYSGDYNNAFVQFSDSLSLSYYDTGSTSEFDKEGKMYFSDGFLLNDFSTWKYSDFILYYFFMEGYLDTDVTNFEQYVSQGYVEFSIFYMIEFDDYGSVTASRVYKFGASETDFGTATKVNKTVSDASLLTYLSDLSEDEYSSFLSSIENYLFVDTTVWSSLTTTLSSSFIYTNSRSDSTVSISSSVSTITADTTSTATTADGASTIDYILTIADSSKDFSYTEYYYFTYSSSSAIMTALTKNTSDVSDSNITSKVLNLKLSDGFKIDSTSTWTVLDFLILLNFSRTNSSNTTFLNMEYSELFYDYYTYTYVVNIDDVDQTFIKINGITYNVTKFMNGESSYTDDDDVTYYIENMVSLVNILSTGYSYSFRVNTGSTNYNIVDTSTSVTLSKTNTSLVYTISEGTEITLAYGTSDEKDAFDDFKYFLEKISSREYTYTSDDTEITITITADTTFYKSVNTNVSMNFQISLTDFDYYYITLMTQQVSWVQKLMNDMQVIYSDLNWATLLATDDWIDTLGDYYSAYASGQYVESGNSANITAYGLVLSEFLLSFASKSSAGYANYEYSSIFDDDTIQALMLSMLGEDDYEAVSQQAGIFLEMFNVAFAQVLDDIAAEIGVDIADDGNVTNLKISIYKAYLATVLLSSDFGEYIYKIATRVYAQYAIYESLAAAGGDYASYYNYINGYTDENGDTVDAFSYGTFQELVIYENQGLKSGSVPTYTFNYYDVYRALIDSNATDTTIEASMNNTSSFNKVLTKLNNLYNSTYLSSRTSTFAYEDTDSEHYSYMLHVYWSIRQELYSKKQSEPTYLKLYYDYITGSGTRRNICMDISISSASQYIEKYYLYQTYCQLYIGTFVFYYTKGYVTTLDVYLDDDQSIEDYLKGVGISANYSADVYRLKQILSSSPTYLAKYNEVFGDFSVTAVLDKLVDFESSVTGSLSSWNAILSMADAIDDLIEEFNKVMELEIGEATESGSVKKQYSEDAYSSISDMLTNLSDSIHNYITYQQIVDKVEKASITFTLAQYSSNYVESGFTFTINGSEYTLQTSVSAQRLAEYVYGGAYLEQFGVSAQYTSSTFEGAIRTSKVIDDDGYVKTKLYSFTELHEFASSLADYTAKLYFMTNLSDLTANTSDSILLTDYIYSNTTYMNTYFNNSGTYYATTLEYLILDHIISDEEISAETLLRLVFGETETTLNGMGCTDAYLIILAKYLANSTIGDQSGYFEGSNLALYPDNKLTTNSNGETIIASLDDDFIKVALQRYLVYVQTTTDQNSYYGIQVANGYSSAGYYGGNNTSSDRIHQIFKKVITYLTSSEEQTSDSTSIGVSGTYLDFDSQITTFKELKSYLMSSIVDYTENEGETGAENTARYLTLFNLISGEFNFYTVDSGVYYSTTITTSIETSYYGRTLESYYKAYVETDTSKTYYTNISGLVSYYNATTGDNYAITGTFQIDSSTRGIILKLCGIENRPIEELVGLEYDELYETDGNSDEADGDTFVVCSYDEERGVYVPFMATNNSNSGTFSSSSLYMQYIKAYGYRIYTHYYTGSYAYPIIAKGILTADLRPTAIKIVDGVVSFYRTDITVTGNVAEDAVAKTTTNVEVSTVGYVKYVNTTSFSNVQSSSESKTMYIGSSDIMSYVNSDADVDYIQYTNTYNIDKVDDYDGISVLDEFSYFWGMSVQMHMMMLLGFITLIPLLFKASGAVLRRVLDLIFLVLAGPLCISMNSLELGEKNHSAYEQWKGYMIKTLLSVFGLVISLNLYYILVSTTMNMTFISEGDSVMQKISLIGGLSFVTASLLNAIIKFMFIIVATNMIEQAGDMLISMITGGKVDKSFNSPLSGENAIDSIVSLANSMKGDIQKITGAVQGVVTGSILVEAKNALIETLPGSKVVSGIKDTVGNVRNWKQSRDMQKKLREKGVSRAMAYAATHQFRANYKKQQKQKRQHKEQMAKNFYSRMGLKIG